MTESALFAALAKAQAAFPSIPKGRTAKIATKSGGSYSYSYADLSDIISAIRKPLADAGLSFSQRVLDGNMVTTIYHADGGVMECGHVPFTTAETLTPQEMGSALTYFRRYSLSAALGLVAEDDDDGAQANEAGKGASARKAPTPRPSALPAVPMSDAARMELSAEGIRVYGKGTNRVLQGLGALASKLTHQPRIYRNPEEITQADADFLLPALKHLPAFVEEVEPETERPVGLSDPTADLRRKAIYACEHAPAGVEAGSKVGDDFLVSHGALLEAAGIEAITERVGAMSADQCTALIEALGAAT